MLTRAVCVITSACGFCICASTVAVLAGGVNTGPPAGIVATTATLQEVLASHDKAVGSSTLPSQAALVEDGTIATHDMSGTYHTVSMRGDFSDTTTLGPFVTREGFFDGQEWSQDENGQVRTIQGIHERGVVDDWELDGALDATSSDVKLLGEVAAPIAAYVVQVDPPDGRPEWIFFDKTSGLIDRIESVVATTREVESFSDFRTHFGTTEPWSSHFTDGDSANDEDERITSMQTATDLDVADVEVPPSRPLVHFPAGVDNAVLPAEIDGGRILLTVTVGGNPYVFQLDSGSSDILVDRDAARSMGLSLYGKRQQTAAGKFTASEATIPEVDLGPLVMRDVAVSVIPFKQKSSSGLDIVGLIGFDFIAGIELRVDYGAGTVTALYPGAYQPPQDAYVVPAALDDQVPVVAAQLGQTIGEHFIIDTGASEGFLFPGFAAAHPQDVADKGAGAEIVARNPRLYAQGVGGAIKLKPTQVAAFRIGGISFDRWVVYTLVNDYAQEEEDYDGLIGYDFLRYFTVVFDYADSQVYLEPSDAARKRLMKQ